MSDLSKTTKDSTQGELDSSPGPGGANLPVRSVSEMSQAIKRALEGSFEFVRVRGEVSGFKRAASGHLYFSLKDESAVLDAVCWRGTAGRLGIAPEDGMEVIASGRITAYAGRSRYQIVIERLELAGEGALLKLLEERKRKLAAEGLFAEERKQALPYLPEVIGVVTSPTGAVIRDILHRLADRFPRHVLVWPVLVQGEGAAEQIAAAIRGFNRLPAGGAEAGPTPRPDLLIVARGGGSLEDLWAFNEEVVVRAAAESEIPLISGVGHETDTTLIDFAADLRAPTPTAAAEFAVPMRRELLDQVQEAERRMRIAGSRLMSERRVLLEGLGRGLPDPWRLIEEMSQRLDDRAERLVNAAANLIARRRGLVAELTAALPHPRQQLALARERLTAPAARLAALLEKPPVLGDAEGALAALARVLESVSYENVLKRGFAVVHGPEGLIAQAAQVTPGLALDIEFGDGRAAAIGAPGGAAAPKSKPKRKPAKPPGDDEPQGSLL
ncbi:MAG: exodeoxyribonuclease VII large subunit [Alphaproteobacteria bacterium]